MLRWPIIFSVSKINLQVNDKPPRGCALRRADNARRDPGKEEEQRDEYFRGPEHPRPFHGEEAPIPTRQITASMSLMNIQTKPVLRVHMNKTAKLR